ncbi:MAG: GIY-YIG nuclease family protein [Candidatus Omnitrophota bacterium]
MPFTVYILTSIANPKRTYIGYTTNITQRMIAHNGKKATGYSNHYAPWKLETSVVFHEKKLALEFERYLKSGSGQAFLMKHFLP